MGGEGNGRDSVKGSVSVGFFVSQREGLAFVGWRGLGLGGTYLLGHIGMVFEVRLYSPSMFFHLIIPKMILKLKGRVAEEG